MSRLSFTSLLPVTSGIGDSAAIYIIVVKFRNTICPPPPQLSPFIGELRCQDIQTEDGLYIAERTQKAVFIVRCLWMKHRNTCDALGKQDYALSQISHSFIRCQRDRDFRPRGFQSYSTIQSYTMFNRLKLA
jgi:hypothetical protein